jgi:hypothetical protein
VRCGTSYLAGWLVYSHSAPNSLRDLPTSLLTSCWSKENEKQKRDNQG